MKTTNIITIILVAFIVCNSCTNDCFAAATKRECPQGQVCLDNPLGADVTPQTFIGGIIRAILGIVGSLALAMFIYGGFTWMTAAGNAEQVTKGRNILVWATIGLIVIFTSYALVRFVLFDVIQAPTG